MRMSVKDIFENIDAEDIQDLREEYADILGDTDDE